MKTQSMLKMLLVAALVVSPVVVMAAADAKGKQEQVDAGANGANTTAPEAKTTSWTDSISNGFSAVSGAIMAVPTWVNENRMLSAVIAYVVYKEAKAYFAPVNARN